MNKLFKKVRTFVDQNFDMMIVAVVAVTVVATAIAVNAAQNATTNVAVYTEDPITKEQIFQGYVPMNRTFVEEKYRQQQEKDAKAI